MRATRATIDLGRIRENITGLARISGPGVALCMAVKANAYGHGLVTVAHTAVKAGVSMLGAATVAEATALRAAALKVPILLLGLPHAEEVDELVDAGAEPMIADMSLARSLSRAAVSARRTVRVHVKVDTGMGRIGCAPEEAAALRAGIDSLPNLQAVAMATHFARADEENLDYTRQQLALFRQATEATNASGGTTRHAANSAALLRLPEAHFDMVRPGIAAYGIDPAPSLSGSAPLAPALRWTTRIVQLKRVAAGTGLSYGHQYHTTRETWIATLPVGYGDGYPRRLSGRAAVAIGGARCPVVGAICMDQMLVDVGPAGPIAIGDEVTLLGDPPAPNAHELAAWLDTIPYEVLTGIAARVPRKYVGGEA